MVGSDDSRATWSWRPPAHLRAVVSLFVVFLTACTAGGSSSVGPSTSQEHSPSAIWTPTPGERWQYQLQSHKGAFPSTGGINVDICEVPFAAGACVRPTVFDIDLYANLETGELNTAAVAAIHAAGGHAVCYIDAGSIETYRPDYQRFVNFDRSCHGCLIGNPFSKIFNDENYANLNNDQGQRDFMLKMNRARVAKCRQAGFDAVEFDVVDSWQTSASRSGWRISPDTQMIFNRALADIAHDFGMAVGLKNDLDQVSELEPSFDFAINEQCFQYHECDSLDPFVQAGKAVFTVEYRTEPAVFCPKAADTGFSSILKSPSFSLYDEPYTPCR
jgi:endo-alpha-1,4-polygalactosaminidase (GH114 family)